MRCSVNSTRGGLAPVTAFGFLFAHVNGQDVSVGAQNQAAVRVATDANHWFASTRYWHTEARTSLETVYYTEYQTNYWLTGTLAVTANLEHVCCRRADSKTSRA